MSTPYTTIYQRFLDKIVDFDLANMEDQDIATYCQNLMSSAMPKISAIESDFSDVDDSGFIDDLTGDELEVISSQMVVEWVERKLNTVQLLNIFVGTKDENMTSQANHINALISLRDKHRATVSRIICHNGYSKMFAEAETGGA